MQAAQRAEWNPALEEAIRLATEYRLPVLVLFCLNPDIPEANLRHYHFLLEGLWETGNTLFKRGFPLLIAQGGFAESVIPLALNSAGVVFDKGYLRWQREARTAIQAQLEQSGISWREVETEAVVPVAVASPKEEYAAATLRPKILRILRDYLPEREPAHSTIPVTLDTDVVPPPAGVNAKYINTFPNRDAFLNWAESSLQTGADVQPVSSFSGGSTEAHRRLELFVRGKLPYYAERRSDPGTEFQSDLSPWLHFGQVSPLEIIHSVLQETDIEPDEIPHLIRHKADQSGIRASVTAFLEELIIRRELGFNLCHYNPDYDDYRSLPVWARNILEQHTSDPRPNLYSTEELENATTHDPYWNAAQRELLMTGKMHNYMRMYWGKKVIEWTPDPETAFHLLRWLNNRYSLDGRDPNSFAGIVWCFGKHDRPWQTRPVFGSVRYMNAAGLERKFDMAGYLCRVNSLP